MLLLDHAARRGDPSMSSYFQEIDESKLLSADEERELAYRIQEGDVEARDHMVRSNLRLVVMIARRFLGHGLSLADLIQEGNLGLVHAAERFDPAQNTRFSTYAKYWIQDALGRAQEKMAGPVHVPTYANSLMTNWRKAANRLHEELGRNPSDEEVADHLHLTRRQLAIVRKAQRIRHGASSESGDERETAATQLVDSRGPAPDAALTGDDEMRHVLGLLDKLPKREAKVLRLRFGLDGKPPMSLSDIGLLLDLTRERVRQIEKEALATLRDFLGDDA